MTSAMLRDYAHRLKGERIMIDFTADDDGMTHDEIIFGTVAYANDAGIIMRDAYLIDDERQVMSDAFVTYSSIENITVING